MTEAILPGVVVFSFSKEAIMSVETSEKPARFSHCENLSLTRNLSAPVSDDLLNRLNRAATMQEIPRAKLVRQLLSQGLDQLAPDVR